MEKLTRSLSRGLTRGLTRPLTGGFVTPETMSISGLESGEARPGSHPDITGEMSDGSTILTYSWGLTLDGSQLGTGENPSDYTAGDGGLLYLLGTTAVGTFRATAPIRYDTNVFTTQPALDQANYNIGDTITLTEGITEDPATLTITTFALDGVDKRGELVGLTWDSSGETAGQLTYQVTATNSGGAVVSNLISAPLNVAAATTYYAAPGGSDGNDGSIGSPFLTPSAGIDAMAPGDTLILRTGTFDPFEIDKSGTAGAPITITTLPEEKGTVIIKGDLDHHNSVPGGDGNYTPNNNAVRDGIRIDSQNHVHVRNLTITDCWRCGIFVIADAGGAFGNIEIWDNLIFHVGASCIRMEGQNSDTKINRTEDGSPRLNDCLVRGNTVYFSNIPNDNILAPDTEAISVAAGCADIDTMYNIVGTTEGQTNGYGIDYKAGVRGGRIIGNRIFNIEKYGIYLDAGRRWVSNITVADNIIYDVELGIVLAREAASGFATYEDAVAADGAADFVQELFAIDIYNNQISNTLLAAIYLQKHSKDGANGIISGIRVRFNSVWNAGRTGGVDFNLFGWSSLTGIPNNVDFAGNVAWNAEGSISFAQAFPPPSWMTYDDNHFGSDPLYANTNAVPADLALTTTSPALATVDGVYVGTPFNLDIDGVARAVPANAGSKTGSVFNFVAELQPDGTIRLLNYDGRLFTVDDALDRYDGDYQTTDAALDAGPVVFKAPVLAGDADPTVGETLTIIPALFGFDVDAGSVTVAYTTNGANPVNVSDPANPTLLLGAADAGKTITVTATATQGANDTDAISNGVAVAAAAAGLQVDVIAIRANTTASGTITETVDLSAYGADDKLYVAYGITRNPNGAVTVDGNAASSIHFNLTGGGGARLRVFEYVLSGPGSANTVISLGLNGSSSVDHIIPIWVVKNGVRGTPSADGDVGAQTNSGGSISATATPGSVNNLLVAVTTGSPGMFGTGGNAHAFTNATQVDDLIAANAGAAIATVATGATTAHTVTFTPNPTAAVSDDAAIALIPFTEAA